MIYFYYSLLIPTRVFVEKEYTGLNSIMKKDTYSKFKNVSFILSIVNRDV
jgi:hypothetical protein